MLAEVIIEFEVVTRITCMCDEKDKNLTCGGSNRNHLRLVEQDVEKQGSSQLSESATSEMRELIEEIQRRAPRKKTAEDDLLPPAA